MKFEIEVCGKKHHLEIHPTATAQMPCAAPSRVTVDGKESTVDAVLTEPGILSLLMEGKCYRVIFDARSDGRAVLIGGQRTAYVVQDPRSLSARRGAGTQANGPQSLRAPMPGRVVRLLASVGDMVAAHQAVLVIEAMKMQNELKAPKAGRIVRIQPEPGATVQAGDVLVVIES